MDADAIFFLLILAVVAVIVIGRVVGARCRADKTIKLVGDIAPPSSWIDHAVEAGRPKITMNSWRSNSQMVRMGSVPAVRGENATTDGAYRVSVTIPEFDSRRTFTEENPLIAVVSLDAFSYDGRTAQVIFLGKYPKSPAFKAKSKMIKGVKKHALQS